jgi:hypothetical protein
MVTSNPPQLACLFWFYKSPELCENRLQLLRRHNPDSPIYGLFGGDPSEAELFQQRLAPWLDDFYVFSQVRTPHWKWYHGDQMIVDWYRQRGHSLDWDTVFIAQWDMLVFDAFSNQISMLKRNELLLSGLRPVSEVDPWWYYVRPNSPERDEYERFIAYVRDSHGFNGPPLCCEFIVACLPRSFMARYANIAEPELGFLEYKIPTYAQIFGTPLCIDHPHQPWWGDAPNANSTSLLARTLNAEIHNVPLRVIEVHRLWPWGRRIFHPVFDFYPLSRGERLAQLVSEILHGELRKTWQRWYQRRNSRTMNDAEP